MRWTIEGAEERTGKVVRFHVEASSMAEAEAEAAKRGVLVSEAKPDHDPKQQRTRLTRGADRNQTTFDHLDIAPLRRRAEGVAHANYSLASCIMLLGMIATILGIIAGRGDIFLAGVGSLVASSILFGVGAGLRLLSLIVYLLSQQRPHNADELSSRQVTRGGQ